MGYGLSEAAERKNATLKKCLVLDLLARAVQQALGSPPMAAFTRNTAVAGVAFLVLLTSACGPKKRPVVRAIPRPVGWTETGIASWYGHPYHGRRAANGEVYDMYKHTAAHQTLPFETWVRVLNLDTNRTSEVRITDRGPFVKGRIIDLSRVAAEQIGMIGSGIAKVRIEVIQPPRLDDGPFFGVQVAAFVERQAAERLRDRLEKRYGPTQVIRRDGPSVVWRVITGHERKVGDAESIAERLRVDKVDGAPDAFVVPLEVPAP